MNEWIPITQDTQILCGVYTVIADDKPYLAYWDGTWKRRGAIWPPTHWPELTGVTLWLYEEKAYG